MESTPLVIESQRKPGLNRVKSILVGGCFGMGVGSGKSVQRMLCMKKLICESSLLSKLFCHLAARSKTRISWMSWILFLQLL